MVPPNSQPDVVTTGAKHNQSEERTLSIKGKLPLSQKNTWLETFSSSTCLPVSACMLEHPA